MKTKVLAITMICYLVMGVQSVFAQDIVPFEGSPGYNVPAPPSQAPQSGRSTTLGGSLRGDWGGGDSPDPNNPTTGGEAPIGSGLWIVAGLACGYSIFCRNRKKK